MVYNPLNIIHDLVTELKIIGKKQIGKIMFYYLSVFTLGGGMKVNFLRKLAEECESEFVVFTDLEMSDDSIVEGFVEGKVKDVNFVYAQVLLEEGRKLHIYECKSLIGYLKGISRKYLKLSKIQKHFDTKGGVQSGKVYKTSVEYELWKHHKENGSNTLHKILKTSSVGLVVLVVAVIMYSNLTDNPSLYAVIFILTTVLIIQGLVNLYGMIYTWNIPERQVQNSSPTEFSKPKYSITALLPALHEADVMADTIRCVHNMDYPDHLKKILIINRADDHETIKVVKDTIKEIGSDSVKLLIPDKRPRSKPDKMNYALRFVDTDFVTIFDAEDRPHHELYNVINTVAIRDDVDVIQSGVQLMTLYNSWFATHNVLEYFFWFKSVLHYIAQNELIPLAGNTVFFKKSMLDRVGGWDAECLTEDADIGIKLSAMKARIRLIYDPKHATQEETPPNTWSHIKQRTRWNQGFLEVLVKGDWATYEGLRPKLFLVYILTWPLLQGLLFIYTAFSVASMVWIELPVLLTLYAFIPVYLLIVMLVILNIGLYEFTSTYKIRYRWYLPIKMVVTFIPYIFILGFASFRAVYRFLANKRNWEKTEHLNAHLKPSA